MKLLLITDTHGTLTKEKITILKQQTPDTVICMGDMYLNDLKIIREIFNDIQVCGVPGNHEPMDYIEKEGMKNLHGRQLHVGDFTMTGLGGSLKYKDEKDLLLISDWDSKKIAKSLPSADILITHSPFKVKYLDKAHQGLSGINWYIKHQKPKYHFYGHVHQNNITVHKNGTKSIGIYQAAIFDLNTEHISRLF